MTPERIAKLVTRWVRFYTRDLPPQIAQRRADEIKADVHDHIADGRTHGIGNRRIALGILSRMVRGLAADASWRGQTMREHKTAYRSTIGIFGVAGFILLLPLVAMLVTDEVVWGPFDFAVAGALLVGTGLAHRAVVRRAGNTTYRVAAAVALAGALMLVWASLAVGIIGSEGDPADLMYLGVLAVGVVGAVIVRFRPAGMARTLLAMALAQTLIAAIALATGKHQAPNSSVVEILGVNAFFAVLFVGSAWLFRRAARKVT